MTRTEFILIAALLGLIVPLGACSSHDDGEKYVTRISVPMILASQLSEPDKAEEIAKGAEVLITARGFPQAYDLAVKALEIDPANLRAGFIKALTGILVPQKGIAARVQSLVSKNPSLLKQYNEKIEIMKGENASPYDPFFLDGQPDIKTEAQAQAHMDLTLKAADEARLFMQKHKGQELKIKPTTTLVPDMIERYARACEIKTTPNMEYELVCPSAEARFYVTLNRADFESFQGMAAYLMIYASYYTSYDLTGLAAVLGEKLDKPGVSSQEIADTLLREPKFATLRQQNRLKQMKGLGLDIVAGLNWMMKNQATLCPTGQQIPRNRPGKFFASGVCLGSQLGPWIEQANGYLEGVPADFSLTKKDGSVHNSKSNAMVLFTNPIEDFRTVGPFKVNNCGQLTWIRDGSLHGSYPKGDLNTVQDFSNSNAPCDK